METILKNGRNLILGRLLLLRYLGGKVLGNLNIGCLGTRSVAGRLKAWGKETWLSEAPVWESTA